MKLRSILAGAIALVLSASLALAQGGQGSSPMTIVKGGTNATTASAARTNLGVAIGSNVQAWDADLDALAALSGTNTIYYRSGAGSWAAVSIGSFLAFSGGTLNVGDAELTALAGLTSANNKCFYWTGSGTAATYDCSSFGRSVANAADAAALRTLAGTVIGTDVQAYDVDLAALAGLTSANNKCFYWTGSGTAATFDCSSFGRSVTNVADAAALRTLSGSVIGTDVQAYDADLAALAGLTSANNKCFYWTGSGTAANYDCSSFGRTWSNYANAAAGTAALDAMVGDSGSGGTKGLVPAPASGDAAANKVLGAGGTWVVQSGGGGSTTAPYEHGRLTYVSATAVKFAPFKGDQVKINGVLYSIPAAGITGCANTSVFVNGTGSSNLASSTFYYVYAFINSATVTCDFRTDGNGHLPSDTAGNVGVEVRVSSGTTKDDTRTLIGMVRTNGSSQFVNTAAQRFVRSWYNRVKTKTGNSFSTQRSTSSTSYVELNSEIRNEFLIWSDEVLSIAMTGPQWNSSAGAYTLAAFGLDGTTPYQVNSKDVISYGYGTSTVLPNGAFSTEIDGASEGYHYVTLLGRVSAGTGNWGELTAYFITMTGSIF